MCMIILSACTSVHHKHGGLAEAEDVAGSPVTRVTEHCQSSCGCLVPHLGSLQGQQHFRA